MRIKMMLLATFAALSAAAGEPKVWSENWNGWTLQARNVAEVSSCRLIEEYEYSLSSPTSAVPPHFTVELEVPQLDAHHRWTASGHRNHLPPNWEGNFKTRLSSSLPLWAYVSDTDENRLLVAASEAKRTVSVCSGLKEENCLLTTQIAFFSEPEAPISSYKVRLRIDRRPVFFGDAIREGTAWIERTAGIKPVEPPPAAFLPLYSAWYSFHQNVFDKDIEAECEIASKLGMKVLIVDDGWQTEDTNRGYSFCGDWQISKRRFPDMAAHVKRVHAMGMKYMMWYSVPFVGPNSKNYARFKGKYLHDGGWGAAVLDPRFPEVRQFLVDTYVKALKEWNLDGFKLDFIDQFNFGEKDPAVAENYAGRDIKAVPEAVDVLMKEVYAKLKAIKPDVLIEFRQNYIGPAIRQYGNMMRAADCPGDLMENRRRTADLRLTSGKSAVHADMLEWNRGETAESAARFVLSTIFSVIQYSVMLRGYPASHREMIAHWIRFSQEHRDALLHGEFRPHHFEAGYPWIEGESAAERIVGVYVAGTSAPVDASKKPTYVLNGTGIGEVVVDSATATTAVLFDTFGKSCGAVALQPGLNRVKLPVSGYLKCGTAERPVKLSFAGDAMCLKEQLKAVKDAKVGWDSVFAPVKRLFADSDYVVANLETPLAGEEIGYTKADARFNTPDAYAVALKGIGVTCANTANNHCMDMKAKGLDRTIEALDRIGLDHFGTYLDKEAADAPYVRTVRGLKIAFVGATYGTATEWGDIEVLPPEKTWKVDFLKRQETGNPYWPERKHPVYVPACVRPSEITNPANEPFRKRLVDKIAASKQVADFTVALPHVGGQFNPTPGDYAKYTVEWMAHSGADLVVGAHPHTTQRCERFENGIWAAYSLGNFAFTPYVGWYVHGQLAEYAAVLHAYLDPKTAKLLRLTFSVVKSVVDADGVARTYPITDVAVRTTDPDAKQMLRLEVEAMVNRFRGTSSSVEISDEYELSGL